MYIDTDTKRFALNAAKADYASDANYANQAGYASRANYATYDYITNESISDTFKDIYSKLTPINLLKNSNFSRDPVNETGVTSASSSWSYKEFPDGWNLFMMTAELVGDVYLKLKRHSIAANYSMPGDFSQDLQGIYLPYQYLTCVISFYGGKKLVVSKYGAAPGITKTLYEDDSLRITTYQYDTYLNFCLSIKDDSELQIFDIGLYEGDYSSYFQNEMSIAQVPYDIELLRKYGVKKLNQADNLLINSNFYNPINSNNTTSLLIESSSVEFLDNWVGNNIDVIIESNKIKVRKIKEDDTIIGYIQQNFKKRGSYDYDYDNYTVTINDEYIVASGTIPSTIGDITWIYSSETELIGIGLTKVDEFTFGILVAFYNTSGYKSITNIGCYHGTYSKNSISYRPKSYEEELLACNAMKQQDNFTGAIDFPISMDKGGTEATSGDVGLKNLLAAGSTILSSYQYGNTLPSDTTAGRLFYIPDDTLSLVYPIGAVYISVDVTSPASLFGSTWVQMTSTISGCYMWKRIA